MIFYSWTALSENGWTAPGESDPAVPDAVELSALTDSGPGTAGSAVAMGITDDRGLAMLAAEESLGSGQAAMVFIEAVRPAMAAHTLAPCYVRIGVGWVGQCTDAGKVVWNRFFFH
jgi:hypothetical protein